MDDKEVMRTILLKLVDLSNAELKQLGGDISKLGFSDAHEEWLLSVIRVLVDEDNRHFRKGFIDGIIQSNDLNP